MEGKREVGKEAGEAYHHRPCPLSSLPFPLITQNDKKLFYELITTLVLIHHCSINFSNDFNHICLSGNLYMIKSVQTWYFINKSRHLYVILTIIKIDVSKLKIPML